MDGGSPESVVTGGEASGRITLLVYDPVHQGHHGEYLAHVLRYLPRVAPHIRATYVVHPEFTERYSDLVAAASASGHAEFVELEVRRSSETSGAGRLAMRSLVEWRTIEREARLRGVDACLLMELNPLQLALALPRVRSLPFSVHGILFHPYPRLRPQGGGTWSRVRSGMVRTRKRWLLHRVARDTAVRTIFVLNDPAAVKILNEEAGGSRAPFALLPDPVPARPASADGTSSEGSRSARADRKVVVTPGAIRRNKGVLEALDGFCRLEEEVCRTATYRIMGRVEEGLGPDLEARVARARRERPGLDLRLDDGFLSDEDFHRAVAESDAVLMPYLRSEGSSGILGHAARERTPVLGPTGGLLGELIEAYGLGLHVDTSDPAAIARGLRRILTEEAGAHDPRGMERYVRERTPEAFVRALLAPIGSPGSEPGAAA